MNATHRPSLRLALAAACALALAGVASAAKGGPGDDPKKPRPKAVITALEKGYEQEKLRVIAGRGGLPAFELVYEEGCAKPCGPATLQLTAESEVTVLGKRVKPQELRRHDGKPATIYVKFGTEQVTRVIVY